MILSNTEIIKAIDDGRIIIDPKPVGPFDTTALDLRLGHSFYEPKEDVNVTIKPGDKPISETLKTLYEEKVVDESYTLGKGEFILAQTLERIEIPIMPDANGNYLAARIEGKSSKARCGLLVHFTAPTIHAGFGGNVTLEVINLGKFELTLEPGKKICQLIFETVLGKPEENFSNFQGQSSPIGK